MTERRERSDLDTKANFTEGISGRKKFVKKFTKG